MAIKISKGQHQSRQNDVEVSWQVVVEKADVGKERVARHQAK
jgi:hypothetical protein